MIEENVSSQIPVNQPIQEFPKKKSILVPYLLSLVLVALVSGGGVYLWQKSILKKQEIPLNQVAIPIVTNVQSIIPTAPDDQTADWKIYKNEKFGFEFKIPSSWYIDDSGSRQSGPRINFWNSKEDFLKYISWYNKIKNEPELPPVEQKLSMSVYRGKLDRNLKFPHSDMNYIRTLDDINSNLDLYHYIGESEDDCCVAKINDDNYLVIDNCNETELKDPIINQILSTFKFNSF